MSIDLSQFLDTFLIETGEHLEEFETTLIELEHRPDDKELLNTIFRCAHSIKGGAATFGLPNVAHFTHALETLLDEVRKGEVAFRPPLPQLMLQSIDQIRDLLSESTGDGDASLKSEPLMRQLEGYATGKFQPSAAATPTVVVTGKRQVKFLFSPSGDVLKRGCDPLIPLIELDDFGEVRSLECLVDQLPLLEELDPETLYLKWQGVLETDVANAAIQELFEFVADEGDLELQEFSAAPVEPVVATEALVEEAELADPGVPAASSGNAFRPDAQILRVNAEKMDRLVNLVGELVINQSMLNEALNGFGMDQLPRLVDAVSSMERVCRELQERVMSVRLVPLRQAFGRFNRIVRDLGLQTGKSIELFTAGEDTELDKTLVEAVVDPLTHLVRNAIDHGLETPEDRRAAGKSEMGHLSISAIHEGGGVLIEVADDGRGLNRDRIWAKAIEKGLVSKDMPPLTDEAIHALIFAPGFSTAAAVTDLSGRGVGMDIVRSTIQNMGGSVSLATTPGNGTKFRIRLPLTMAIMEGLLVRVATEVYVLPLTSIVESIRPAPNDVTLIGATDEVVKVRGEVLPIARLHRLFNVQGAVLTPTEGILVIVENEGLRLGILVDELIGQSQMVIKSMETNYRRVEGISGATIMGNGRVALILDIAQLVRSHRSTIQAA